MSALFDHLVDRERKILARLGLVALLAAVCCAVLSVGQKRAYDRALDDKERVVKTFAGVDGSRREKRVEWERWEEAAEDLTNFRTEYLYQEEDGANGLRLDLEGIFRMAGIRVSRFAFSYSELERSQVKKVSAAFSASVTYAKLKNLLALIESFPKLLTVEKIDFADTGSGGGLLRIRMTLAGYYGL